MPFFFFFFLAGQSVDYIVYELPRGGACACWARGRGGDLILVSACDGSATYFVYPFAGLNKEENCIFQT